jgi:DNA polymerase-3 subunit alpha
MINRVRQIFTKNGRPMLFVELEDVQSTIELVVFPRLYEETRDIWQPGKFVVVRGTVDTKGGKGPKIVCQTVDDRITHALPAGQPPEPEPGPHSTSLDATVEVGSPPHVQVTMHATGHPDQDRQQVRTVHDLLTSFEGEDTFSFVVTNERGSIHLDFPNATTRNCVELQQKLIHLLGAAAVRVENGRQE